MEEFPHGGRVPWFNRTRFPLLLLSWELSESGIPRDRLMAVKDRQPGVRRIPSIHDPVLGEVVGRLVRAYQPERIYLFGSAARGDAGPDSDYDIVVIIPDSSPPAQQDERLAYEALVGTGAAVDVLVYRASDFYGRLPLKASLPAAVIREGKLLYAAR